MLLCCNRTRFWLGSMVHWQLRCNLHQRWQERLEHLRFEDLNQRQWFSVVVCACPNTCILCNLRYRKSEVWGHMPPLLCRLRRLPVVAFGKLCSIPLQCCSSTEAKWYSRLLNLNAWRYLTESATIISLFWFRSTPFTLQSKWNWRLLNPFAAFIGNLARTVLTDVHSWNRYRNKYLSPCLNKYRLWFFSFQTIQTQLILRRTIAAWRKIAFL